MFNNLKNIFVERWISPYRGKNDNRNYKYSKNSFSNREEYKLISGWIRKGQKVIDLGCGDGSLLKILKNKGVKVFGVEISESGIKACRQKDIDVIIGRIDSKLPFKEKNFDVAICNVTLQMVMYPEKLLLEMKRIAIRQIITFPNFAFLPNRVDLLINGRMPRIMIPGYDWYSTGHIHQLSISDFEKFCDQNGIKIISQKHIYPGSSFSLTRRFSAGLKFMKKHPNLFASMGVFMTSSD